MKQKERVGERVMEVVGDKAVRVKDEDSPNLNSKCLIWVFLYCWADFADLLGGNVESCSP